MRLLFCCEFYHPSRGGVQEVMRQIAERMVQAGHEVTVATSHMPARSFTSLNGVRIREFKVSGNSAYGMSGEVDGYRDFVVKFGCDAILIKAAQQWTFDALWPVLDRIKCRKLFIPCGFPGLFDDVYRGYYQAMPDVLRRFDTLIFYSRTFRDIEFARRHGLSRFAIIPNGASELEFADTDDGRFRKMLGIPQNSFLFLSVGRLSPEKGHLAVAEAFARFENENCHATLIINANEDAGAARRHPAVAAIVSAGQRLRRLASLPLRAITLLLREGAGGLVGRLRKAKPRGLRDWIADANASGAAKLAKVVDLARPDLVRAFKAADLFVFASKNEYSPLVLFESAAAGTPFVTVSVGNAKEIAEWTGGGILCPSKRDGRGHVEVDPAALAALMRQAMQSPDKLRKLGARGRENWQRHYTWAAIARAYEVCLAGGTSDSLIGAPIPEGKALVEPAAYLDVDVLIPVRDGARFLPACLDSVFAQTPPPRAVIVVDDGSTDETPRVLAGYAARQPNLRVIRCEARGVSHARNLALQASEASFVAFLDSDDILEPDKLAKQMGLFEASGPEVGIVHCAYFCIDENGRPVMTRRTVPPRKRGDVFADLLQGYALSGSASAVVARRRLVEAAGGFDEALFHGEDWDLWLKMAKSSQIDFVPEALTGIRIHADSSQRKNGRGNAELFLLERLRIVGRWIDHVPDRNAVLKRYRIDAVRVEVKNILGIPPTFGLFRRLRTSDVALARRLFANRLSYVRSVVDAIADAVRR
jgi:L-malate glycosyltransferase